MSAPSDGIKTPQSLSELPPELASRIRLLREAHRRGAVQRDGAALRFEDGSAWFANGYEVSLSAKDGLADGVPVLCVVACVVLAAVTYYAFSDDMTTKWAWVGATLAAMAVAAVVNVRRAGRTERAVARMDLGTLLLEDALVLVSHGRYVVIPRSQVTHTGLDRVGTSNVVEIRSVFYRAKRAQRAQHLSGFGRTEAVAQLEREGSAVLPFLRYSTTRAAPGDGAYQPQKKS